MADEPHVLPINFGSLKTFVATILDRGGDSVLADGLAGLYVNAAEVFISSKIGAPSFLEHSDTITGDANDDDLTFPLQVSKVVSIIDQSNNHQLTWVDRARWNSVIVNPAIATGIPTRWTQWGYNRRENVGSPSQPYGQIKVKVFPTPTSAMTWNYDCILRPGTMVLDTDFPVLPPEFHYGIIEVALMHAGPYDIGMRAFREHREMAMDWVGEIVRAERRNMAGNQRIIAREEDVKSKKRRAYPLTRAEQLNGGY